MTDTSTPDPRPCAKCGATPRRKNSSYCDDCYREYYRLRQRARRKDPTLCCRCGQRPRAKGKSRCLECLADERRIAADRRDKRASLAERRAELLADAAAARDALAALKARKL